MTEVKTSSRRAWTAVALAIFVACFGVPSVRAEALGATAYAVLGQSDGLGSPSFTNGAANDGGSVGATGFSTPGPMYLDLPHSRLFIADRNNNRVLVYAIDASGNPLHTYADHVIGQPDFTSNGAGATQSSFNQPFALTYEPVSQHLFVGGLDGRILVFYVATITDGMNASYVLGENDFTSTGGPVTQSSFGQVYAMTLDLSRRRLFMADPDYGRVLVFDVSALSNGMAASYVIGAPDFTTASYSATATTLAFPSGLAYEPARNLLYVSDWDNRRLMIYSLSSIADGMAASHVLLQNDFTSTSYLTDQSHMNAPTNLALDTGNNRLWVADRGDNRILQFDVSTITDGMNAVDVLGQSDFTSNGAGTSATTLYTPQAIVYDGTNGHLIVADRGNHRVLFFDVASAGQKTASVSAQVDPTLTFAVSGRSTACNGVALTSTASSATSVSLGHVTAASNAVAAQDLAVTTNAIGGFTVFLREVAQMNDGNGHSIPDVPGDNTTPATFPSVGTAGFGYSTSDATLSGTVDRFTNPSATWAKLTTSNQPVSFASAGPVTADTSCVVYRMGVTSTTPAGTYSTTAVYTVVPLV